MLTDQAMLIPVVALVVPNALGLGMRRILA